MNNILNEKNNAEIIPASNIGELSVFLEKPREKIAAAITGALSLGKREAILIGGRLIQGAIAGKLMKQFGQEIKGLIEAGKINEDYAKDELNFKSLGELLSFIDSEAPDEKRFFAIKSLFYSIITENEEIGDKIINYQLFQISLKLSSSQLLILKICFDIYKNNNYSELNSSAEGWLKVVAKKIGHNITDLLLNDEQILMEKYLITNRQYPDKSGVRTDNARLSELGIKLCEKLQQYSSFSNLKS